METDFSKFLDSLTPLERDIIKASLDQYLNKDDENNIPNHINSDNAVTKCPKCGSVHFIKNGFDCNHKQKYRCKECHTVFSSTTGTMFSNSPNSLRLSA